ncbi:MAG TPA: SDR family NAD(P)-dependent oxidoreductase [Acidimicrobiales bacterium]|jgi:NAD(P)-dependent dehydrogenase (short-subunit alcohol dehydrogenase family)
MDDLGGKVAVVTGGASGIGRAMAERFAAEGMQVVIADIEKPALDAAAADLGIVGVVTDVSDAASVQALADEVVARFGAVHLIANNAGVGGRGRIRECSLDDWNWVLGVNLWGVVHGVHAFLPLLLANPDGGHIVNTASVAGHMAPAGLGPYATSKYAVVALSEALAAELEQDGAPVHVSVLCPGFVRTNIYTSERNRPAGLAPAPERPLFSDEARAMIDAAAIDPAVVADAVVDAVRHDRFWVFTHPDLMIAIESRLQGIVAAGRAAPPG